MGRAGIWNPFGKFFLHKALTPGKTHAGIDCERRNAHTLLATLSWNLIKHMAWLGDRTVSEAPSQEVVAAQGRPITISSPLASQDLTDPPSAWKMCLTRVLWLGGLDSIKPISRLKASSGQNPRGCQEATETSFQSHWASEPLCNSQSCVDPDIKQRIFLG